MSTPIIEVYVLWHPGDKPGARIADDLIGHFHGTAFTGLLSGAVDVYVRHKGWRGADDAPRPIPMPGDPPTNGMASAGLVAVVPVLGVEMAAAVENKSGPWHRYLRGLVAAERAQPERIGVFPTLIHDGAIDGTELYRLIGKFGFLGYGTDTEVEPLTRRRDLTVALSQLAGGKENGRVRVFISHTRRKANIGDKAEDELVDLVRAVVRRTRLDEFFDTSDLRPGSDWSNELMRHAGSSALLAIRTDKYATREWCQREMLIAKHNGMPIVVLDALRNGEERGSFLLDHVPRIPVRGIGDSWSTTDIRTGLDLLLDEHLKRILWRSQQDAAREHDERLDIAWWAPHAPEPVTLMHWLANRDDSVRAQPGRPLRILHPDPPLCADERAVLDELAQLCGIEGGLDIMTPRMLAVRGGGTVIGP